MRHRNAAVGRAVATLATTLVLFLGVPPSDASTVSSASFQGGSGTVSVGGTLYAKNGGALALTVNTSADAKCVDVTGGHTGHQTSATAKSTWTFPFTADAGDGIRTVTATASPNFNQNNGQCTGQSQSPQSASYVLDNTGPTVTASATPAANPTGWNNSNVGISWFATDTGSGVGSGPSPATDSITVDSAGTTRTSTAADRLGNLGSGSVTVKLDKGVPTIVGGASPAANANGWNGSTVTVSFACSDALSGIKSCTGTGALAGEGANQAVIGTAVDNADNSASTSVNVNIDKTAPALSGAPTAAPNAAGWYNSSVAIGWSCSDSLSGIDGSCPANSTISSEGTGLTSTRSVSDLAGNTTTAASSPGVRIDKTAPVTQTSVSTAWTNGDVTLVLVASDALSGVRATHYAIDGGGAQDGTQASLSAEGVHAVSFWSEDNAGNVETPNTVTVKIDKTAPTIVPHQAPLGNANGWNRTDVTVSFDCNDTLSGVASCTGPTTLTGEGAGQEVNGTAVDNADNSATASTTVSIDTTPPTIHAAADRSANGYGWYDADVTVSFTCQDVLSGIESCPAPTTVGEGANQGISGTATDAAGNTASDGVAGINVDESKPTLSGAATTSPNDFGWYRGDVTVHWTCDDSLSGLDGPCPADGVVTGEGAGLSASASVADRAGNVKNATVSGIQIDRTAPSTLISLPDPLASTWYGGPVTVTLHPVDSLSGLHATFYSVDGGAAHAYAGPFSFGLGGIHALTFWSTDRAGNTEDNTAVQNTVILKIDNVPPTIDGHRVPVANEFGWNNGPVTVTFDCADAESGVAACDPGVTLDNEGAGQGYTGTAQDVAGNSSQATVDGINIDLTPPTLTGAATDSPNAFGWYRGDVTVHWTGTDGLSGIDPATQPADDAITGEGGNLGAGPASVSDRAGNIAFGSVSGIRIDRTPPAISGAVVKNDGSLRTPNPAGWFNSAVRVRFACSDALSGVQECGQDVVLSGDGAGQSASGGATDRADNVAGTTLSGINIDAQRPQSSAAISCTKKNGYCSGSSATVVLTAVDQAGLSGVKEIHYSVDGGAWVVSAGASKDVPVPLSGSGTAAVAFYAVDNAGNSEALGGVDITYDTIAPAVTHTLNPAANAAGWNNVNTAVHFDARDDSDGSGVDPSTVTPDQTVSTETAGLNVNGSAEDYAGNVGVDSVTVRLDKTAPTISGAATTSPNADGWYQTPVTVTFACNDGLSGVATCGPGQTLSTDGANQAVTGNAVDKADNASSKTVSGINIDTAKPAVTVNGVTDGGVYTLGSVPGGSCTASDGGSGLTGPCSFTRAGGLANGVGTFAFTATATDRAGNTSSLTGSYRVIYRFDGFLQPINDTAHQIGVATSVFKAGSTVPAKLQLMRADGTVVSVNAPPQWLTPVKGTAISAPVDESLYGDPATSGSTYRWDSSGQQYLYNWGTSKSQANSYWRVGVQLDDGQTYYVNIGLR